MADGLTAYTPWFRSSGGETGKRPMFFAHHGGGSNSNHTQNGSTFKINLTATPDVDSTGDFDQAILSFKESFKKLVLRAIDIPFIADAK